VNRANIVYRSLYGTALGYLPTVPSELAYIVWLTQRRKPSEVVLDWSARRAKKTCSKSHKLGRPNSLGPLTFQSWGTRPTGPIGWLRLWCRCEPELCTSSKPSNYTEVTIYCKVMTSLQLDHSVTEGMSLLKNISRFSNNQQKVTSSFWISVNCYELEYYSTCINWSQNSRRIDRTFTTWTSTNISFHQVILHVHWQDSKHTPQATLLTWRSQPGLTQTHNYWLCT
jgi:hypothetical protein